MVQGNPTGSPQVDQHDHHQQCVRIRLSRASQQVCQTRQTFHEQSSFIEDTNKQTDKKTKSILILLANMNKDNNLNSIEFVSSHANGVRFYDEFVNVPITRTQWMKIRDG